MSIVEVTVKVKVENAVSATKWATELFLMDPSRATSVTAL
jgi:hypothetical protein